MDEQPSYPNVEEVLLQLSSAEGFERDKGNAEKNLKYGVRQNEIEQIFLNSPYVVLTDFQHSVEKARWKIFGKTSDGRLLLVVFTIRKKLIRPISARAMNKKEKHFYEEEIKR
ncbi:MAG: BrnT family toxin [Bacteroidota bacterium]|nr:BrnT family toxin [Bacteroidota bacterium]